ncbi:hypothetical protein [Porphyrobacter sp. AAP82]|uniref:hypothetical protein n=1 Tax=Porphyrobacter sp. AAP82 TaxID=1248917 RepID=UPI0002DA03BE|nr:hypothetical protein [Porphyrobacter sp. AAP82]
MFAFNRFVASAALASAAWTGASVPLAAQEQAAPERPAATWRHDRSGLTLSAVLAGFTRGDSKQFDAEGYNIGINFRDPQSRSWADLYIYRAAPASVAVLGDRAAAGMFANPMLGDVDANAVSIVRFTPPAGAGDKSGLRIVTPTKGELTSSGLAIWLHDGWLVKLRMSSKTLDAATLEARMSQFIAAVTLPAATRPAPAFAELRDCAAPMKPGKKARLVELDVTGSIMIGGLLGGASEELAETGVSVADGAADPVWCRDAGSQPQYGIYRREGIAETYLIALGDTGTSLSVAGYDAGPLMKPSKGFLVTQSNGVTEQVYPPFDRLPTPEQALGLPGKVSPVFSAGLLAENKGTTIMVTGK